MGKRDRKRREMARLIERWRASGLSVRAFAREAHVPESKLWYWRKRVEGIEAAAFVPVQIVSDETDDPGACFELLLRDGRKLRIPPALTGRPLRQLLLALRAC